MLPPSSSSSWIMDSGATHHLTSDLDNLSLHQPYSGNDRVLIGDGSGLPITHSGSLSLSLPSRNLTLTDVLCVPHIHKNLISVYRLCNANKVSVEFFPASFQVNDLSSGVPLLHDKTKGDLYEWPVSPSIIKSFFTTASPTTTIKDWHNRLGHPSISIIKAVAPFLPSLKSQTTAPSFVCSDCSINKSQKLHFSQTNIVSTRPLEYIFSDLWTSPTISVDKFKYYVVFIDHFTRYTWLYPLKTKDQTRETFITYKALVENKFQTKIGTLYSDNGGEYIALRSFLASSDITHLTSPPHTPEHKWSL